MDDFFLIPCLMFPLRQGNRYVPSSFLHVRASQEIHVFHYPWF